MFQHPPHNSASQITNDSGISGSTTSAALLTLDNSSKGFRSITSVTGSYTPSIDDAGKLITVSGSVNINITIPPSSSAAFSAANVLTFMQIGGGSVTFLTGSGVTLSIPSSRSLLLSGSGHIASFVNVSSNFFRGYGDLVSA